MRLQEYIYELQNLLDRYGDLPVKTYGYSGVRDVSLPSQKFLKKLSKRESKGRYWESYMEPTLQGEKVIDI